MDRTPKHLELTTSYRFRVVADSMGTRFAGDLSLGPEGCGLVIRGDVFGDRRENLDWFRIDSLECEALSAAFLLTGLSGRGGFSTVLQRHPTDVGHFEHNYAVNEVVYSPHGGIRSACYTGFRIHAPSIARWIGITNMQRDIVTASQTGALFGDDGPSGVQFAVAVPGGHVAVVYQLSMGQSMTGFEMGVRYPPALTVSFDAARTIKATIAAVREMEALFSFLLGHPLAMERIELHAQRGGIDAPSLYVAGHPADEEAARRYPFFPLGQDLSHDQLGLPPLPLGVFPTYLALADGEREYIKKYLRYRELKNPEERFLGFFRLLEKLCHQKDTFLPPDSLTMLLKRARPFLTKYFDNSKNVRSLIKGVERWNGSKLNTAACIERFMAELPEGTMDRWRYKPEDVAGICKLRNDLTHANDVNTGIDTVERFAKFIEALLVIKLLGLLGVALADAGRIVRRLPGFHLVELVG